MKRRKARATFAAYITIKGLGGFQEKFISELITNDIQIYEICQDKDGFTAVIKPYSYLKTARIARKHGIRLNVTERQGFIFRLLPLRKRWGLVTGALCCCAVIVLLSQFVWRIDIIGNSEVTDTQICAVMEKNGLMPGCSRKSFDEWVCEQSAMAEISRLSWVAVERQGSRVSVKVAETNDPEPAEIPIETPCNVISDFDGQLIYTEIYKGKLQTTVGSGIAKGQLIISGTVNDNGGHIVYVHADGLLKAQCEQTEEFFLPFEQTRSMKTDEKYYSTYLMFGSFALPLPWEHYEAENMDGFTYSEDTYNVSILGADTPYRYKRGVYTRLSEKTVRYTARDIMTQLEKQKKDYEDNFLSDCKILSDEKKVTTDEKGIKMAIKYKVERYIGVKQPITVLY